MDDLFVSSKDLAKGHDPPPLFRIEHSGLIHARLRLWDNIDWIL